MTPAHLLIAALVVALLWSLSGFIVE